jgi:hypothetical protein
MNMDLHELDILIDTAGHLPTDMNGAIVAALSRGVPFEAIQPVLTPLAKMSEALQRIQKWSDDAKAQPKEAPSLPPGKVVADVVAVLPPLTAGRTRRSMYILQAKGDGNSPEAKDLESLLDDTFNEYKNLYGPGGRYYDAARIQYFGMTEEQRAALEAQFPDPHGPQKWAQAHGGTGEHLPTDWQNLEVGL